MQNFRTRKQIRLRDYDYSKNGFYFITICTKNRECIFGDIPVGADGCPPADTIDVQLNDFGIIVDDELKKSPVIREEIILDQYVVMPNHVHCIIIIENTDRDTDRHIVVGPRPSIEGRQPSIVGRQPSAPTAINRKRSLSSFVQGFKSAVTARINTLRNMPGKPVWQRSFYDHIIRNERSLNAIREYIARNPINWEQDIDNLINL